MINGLLNRISAIMDVTLCHHCTVFTITINQCIIVSLLLKRPLLNFYLNKNGEVPFNEPML